MKIVVVSKNPPGGRCTLYTSYAMLLAECFAGAVETVFPYPDAALQPPALLVHGAAIPPADGLILSPDDVHAGLVAIGVAVDEITDLLARLEAVETAFMESLA